MAMTTRRMTMTKRHPGGRTCAEIAGYIVAVGVVLAFGTIALVSYVVFS